MKKKLPENSPEKIRNLLGKTVIPLIANLTKMNFTKLAKSVSSVFKIGNLGKIIDEFDGKMTKGQYKTLELLGKTIQENLQQGLENTIEPTLLRFARIGDENENMVAKLLRKCVDSDGKIAQNDFENCLVEIVKNLKFVESQEINLKEKHDGSEVFSEDGQIIGWVYNSTELPNRAKLETSEILGFENNLDDLDLTTKLEMNLKNFGKKESLEKELAKNKQVQVISINLAGANNHKAGDWTQTRIDKYNHKIRSILTELEKISSQNKKLGISTVFFCEEVPFNIDLPVGALNLGEEIARLGGTAIFALQENCGNQVAIITMEPNILPNQKLRIIPPNSVGDFDGFMNMPEKIATQALVLFQIEINNKIINISGTHQLAPTSIIQRIISRVVEMALIHAKIIEFAIGDDNPYGINVDKPLEIGKFTLPNLPYAFLVSIVMIIISNFLSDLVQNSNSPKLQKIFQKLNKNLGEIETVRKLAKLVNIGCPIPEKPTFEIYGIPTHILDLAMAKISDLESGILTISSVPLTKGFSDHSDSCRVLIKPKDHQK